MRLARLLGPDLKQVLKEDPDQVRELFDEIHPEDLADIVGELDPDEAAQLLSRLSVEYAAPIFERLEEEEQGEIAPLMPPESVAQIASEMAPDDRADFFSVLPDEVGDVILQKLERVDPEAAEEVREIEKWPETSAGHLMTTAYVHIGPDVTVRSAIDAVRVHAENHHENVYNIYAIDSNDRLIGIASLRDLLLATPLQPLREILRTNIISVRPTEDQEEVARRMAKYDLNVIPVVDDRDMILGVITVDDIIDVLTQEQTEDVQKLGAIEPLDVPYFRTSFLSFIKKRGVWLFALFFGEFFTQTALRHYDPVFEAVKGAAYYVPLLISAGGNSGSQSSTLIIRGLAVGEIKLRDWWRILIRETFMGLVLGIGLAVVGFGRVLMYPEQHTNFAFTVAFTLVGIVMTGCTVGAMMPLVLKKIGLDPATSSTPFIASLVDVLGIVIFVHIAKIIMANVIAAAGVN
ncbi:Mg/Co/Ni transporter MgtE / CBS domain protein [Labilithrix luteola]|uniref:Magnesium transporter MgtE n=1 Tax=Labilithrix luteola TaxID=1391654 RepID=A0A0K1QC80_9BACT|nr:magnesium transporter [Labilithrix luteola]AKV03333.1 Mg/Co/Ni transporter MgtE / CBS domain protein [Labilithrix luteola]